MRAKNIGIDNFRFIASVMVVAIHCFPFQSLNKELDTLITLSLFRVAVPFFLMVSGYYLLGPMVKNNNDILQSRVIVFLKKQTKIYLLASFMYLPLAFYNHTLSLKMSFFNFIQILFFDGVLYHLWYFPALILGTLIVSSLLTKFKLQTVLIITFIGYFIALGGDSWWGIWKQFYAIKMGYELLFQLFGLTRNGIFYTPFFLALGAYFYQKERKNFISLKRTFFFLFSIGMLIESYLLHLFKFPKHDSMYLFLPFVMIMLFPIIFYSKPKMRILNSSNLSLGIYLLHPYVIAALHFFIPYLPILNNSMIYYLSVLLISYLLVRGWLARKTLFKKLRRTSIESI